MYNYFTDTILSVDAYLLGVLVFMIATIFAYVLVSERADAKRKKGLLNIKRNVYDLILSDREGRGAACPVMDFTPQQFLDIETNRIRDAVFFNKSEQDAFRDCIVTPEKVKMAAGIAGRSGDKWKRIEAIISLGYMGASAQLDILRKALFDRDEDVSYFSMISLAQIKNGAAARALIEFMKTNVPGRRKVVSILEGFDDAASEAAPLLKDSDPNMRFWAVKLLTKVKADRYVKTIEGLTYDKDEEVRAAACEYLGRIGRLESKGSLVKCLKDGSWSVRVSAIKGLSALLGNECIPEITPLVNDNSLSVLDVLTDTIARHIDAAGPFIEKSLRGDDPIAKRIAAEAVGSAEYMTKRLKGEKKEL